MPFQFHNIGNIARMFPVAMSATSSPPPHTMTDELITIASYEFVAEAEIAQMVLRENGVDAFLRDQSIIAMDWLLGNAIGYVKLQVPESQAERAVELLAALKQESAGNDETGSAGSCVCPTYGLVLGNHADRCPACIEASENADLDDADGDVVPSRQFLWR